MLLFILAIAPRAELFAQQAIIRALDEAGEPDSENPGGSPEDDSIYVDAAIYNHAFTLLWENDVIYGKTDQYYTNGVRMEYATLYDWRKFEGPVFDLLPEAARSNGVFVEDAWVLAQNMYSPTNIARSDVTYGDRPYAGWTYLGKRYGISKARSYHSFELDLGVVGPNSQAKEVQTFVHEEITGSPTPHWGNQIPNFFAVRANYYYSRAITPSTWRVTDFAPFLNLDLGNVTTSAGVGFTWRLGLLGEDQGHLPFERGVGRVDDDTFELYFFVRPEGTGVLYNGLLSSTVDAQNRYTYASNSGADVLAYDDLSRRLNGDNDPFNYLGYYSLVENEGIVDPNTRFSVFQRSLGSRLTNPGTQYLVYNTLFQGGETIDETIKLSVLYSALQDPGVATDPLRLFWLYQTVGRKPGERLDPAAKYLAYRILTEGTEFDPLRDFFVYYTLFQKHDPAKAYTVRPRPFTGGLRTGMVLNYGPVTVLTAIAIKSAEFYQKGFLPGFHKWFTLQATVRF
ncbi:MAG: lipid A deacylase LpxR family protein [bacterium]|nr:lipid A deacylase LpxR family protein [bacterium]